MASADAYRSRRRGGLAKRLLDVGLSVGALGFGAPIVGACAVAIGATMGSPVLFRQLRPGLHGRPFELLKLRTMRATKPDENELSTDRDRITPLGRFLRKTSLDELPQLWNVLRGDMSLVGPRPLLMPYLARYSPEQARRHDVKPGITGWTQVNGRNALTWEEKLALDVWYVDNRTFWLDLRILSMTVSRVVRSEGISNASHATMPEFMGSSPANGAGPHGRPASL